MSRILFVLLCCFVLEVQAIVMAPGQPAQQAEKQAATSKPSSTPTQTRSTEKQSSSVSSSASKALVGKWSGTYLCEQGETSLEIEVDSKLNGILRFFASNSSYGKFDGFFYGRLSINGSNVSFRPTHGSIDGWHVPPSDGGRSWGTFGFNAILDSSNKTIAGNIQKSLGCSTINLVYGRSNASVPAKTVLAPPSKASLGFYQAALNANYDMMELYLQQGADINCLNCNRDSQWTPVYMAVINQNYQLADWLIKRGADITIPANVYGLSGLVNGMTLVMRAAGYSNVPNFQELDYLVKHGADVKSTDSTGRTALHYIRGWGCIDNKDIGNNSSRECIAFVDQLIENGIDVNRQDKSGTTAMMNATNYCSSSAVKLLLSYGANATLKDKLGKTAMDIAMERATQSGQNSPCNEVIKILSNATQVSRATPSQSGTYTKSTQQADANFAGTYSGTYNGSDSGSFQVDIAQDGTAKLSGRSSKMAVSFTGDGKVSRDGSVALGSASTGSTFTGSVNSTGLLSGTWKNTAYNQAGSFQGSTGAANTAAANPLQVINGGLQLLNTILKPR